MTEHATTGAGATAGARTWNVHVIADSDSRWKWGATLVPHLVGGRPVNLHASLLLGRSVPNDQQFADVGIEPTSVHRESIAETVERLADTEAEVVVLACIGGCVQSMMQALARVWEGRTTRPVVVTGYVGLVYERIVDGLIARAGADPKSVVGTALPFLGGADHDPAAAGRDRPYTLTFVTQPGVPESERERRHLLGQAAEYARTYPDREVVFKLRARPGERTTHVEPFHYTTLIPAEELPKNLSFAYGAMSPVLDRTDLCVTVSSTAAVEAMHRGIPTAVLTDYGIREILGNALFLGSGTLTSWPALLRGEVPTTELEWATAHGVHGGPDSYAAAAAKLAELVAGVADLPPLRPWINAERSGEYLPNLLKRYGLDAQARPLDRTPRVKGPLARRAMRRVARRCYRYGVDVLEPRIKRFAQL